MTGHIRRRGKRAWAIVVDFGTDPETGKRRQKWHTVHGTKRDAERERVRLLHELNTGSYVEPTPLTLRDFMDRWLNDYAKANVTGKTYERYRSIVVQHLNPALGNVPLAKLQPLQIQACYTRWREAGRTKVRKTDPPGLSWNTILQHHHVLHKALEMAVRWQLLARNPADAVEPPKPVREEMKAIDEAQTAWLLEFIQAENQQLYAPVLTAITMGMRRGELLALRWTDIDFGAGLMAVRRSLEQTKAAGLRFKDTKGKRSRVLDLPPLLVDALREHQKRQDELRTAVAPSYNENGLVFPNGDGSIWPPDNFTSRYFDLIQRAGLKGIRFHDLRHSHASQLLRHGVHPKVVQERLGHSSVAITMDIYSHLLPGVQREAVGRLDEALKRAIAKRTATGLQ